jgi:hypothetical protein
MLKDRLDGLGHVGVENGGVIVVRGRSFPHHIGGYPR